MNLFYAPNLPSDTHFHVRVYVDDNISGCHASAELTTRYQAEGLGAAIQVHEITEQVFDVVVQRDLVRFC